MSELAIAVLEYRGEARRLVDDALAYAQRLADEGVPWARPVPELIRAFVDADICTLLLDGNVEGARALARGTRWEERLAPPSARALESASARGDLRANLAVATASSARWVAAKDGVSVASAGTLRALLEAIADRPDRRSLMIVEA